MKSNLPKLSTKSKNTESKSSDKSLQNASEEVVPENSQKSTQKTNEQVNGEKGELTENQANENNETVKDLSQKPSTKVSTTGKVVVGYVSNLTGSFRAEQADGQVRELQNNDPIYEGDAVYHNEEKGDHESYTQVPDLLIQMNSGKEVSVTDASYLLFDSTVIGEDKDFAEVETNKREENRQAEIRRNAGENDSRRAATVEEDAQDDAPDVTVVESLEATQAEVEESQQEEESTETEEIIELEAEFVPVNNPPTIFSSTIVVDEDSDGTSLDLDLPFDKDGDEVVVTVVNVPILGTITSSDGEIITEGQIISAEEVVNLKYDAPDDYNGTDEVGELTYTVTDGKETVAGSTSIEVITVNDAPKIGDVDTAFESTFTEGDLDSIGVSVHIVDDKFVIEDVDNSTIESATILLTNTMDSDQIDSSGVTGGISATTTLTEDGLQLILTGSAKIEDYVSAIKTILFVNDSDNPSAEDRIFSIHLNDGDLDSNKITATVKVVPVNDAPILDLDSNDSTKVGADYLTTYKEGTTGVAISDLDTSITDVDDSNIESATITLTDTKPGDHLDFSKLPVGITGSQTTVAGNIVITLEGTSTLSDYQDAVKSIEYSSTSADPTGNNEGNDFDTRTISVVVNDGNLDSNTAISTINIELSNDAPVLDLDGNDSTKNGFDFETTYSEGTNPISIGDTDLRITDLDHSEIIRAKIVITDTKAGDTLDTSNLPDGIVASESLDESGNIVVSLQGKKTLEEYQEAIKSIEYSSTSEDPSDNINGNNFVTRTIEVTVNDGREDSNTATTVINITPVNDTPILDLDGSVAGTGYTTTFTEGIGSTTGTAVAIADTDISITDVDDSNIENATVTLTDQFAGDVLNVVTTAVNGITASVDTSVAGKITATLTGSATLAEYQDRIKAITYQSTSEDPTDNINGNNKNTRTIEVTVNDGNVDSAKATTTINVVPVNDAPILDLDASGAGTGYTATFTEGAGSATGTAVAIADTDISITDVDDSNIE
ncbi:MAG: hypothetical protein KC646_16740, partial [Candidatus Cloacimonetes bacterium]|nr:hypothetical protein [Candidatus Cloacimonadota bacterium]